jgi:hypothetical protein
MTMSATLAQPAARTQSTTMPAALLRLEGAAYLAAAVAAYAFLGHNWWLFALFLFTPDLSMVGYLRGPRAGALTYNLAHTVSLPLLLGVAGLLLGAPLGVQLALVWLAHIGLDRALGYGLKYGDAFLHTHLNEV